MRDLDARQQQLKRELDELAAKRDAVLKSIERRRQEVQERIEKLSAEIKALNASAAPGAVGISPYQRMLKGGSAMPATVEAAPKERKGKDAPPATTRHSTAQPLHTPARESVQARSAPRSSLYF